MSAILPATTLAFSQSLLSSVNGGESYAQQLETELATGSSILAPSANPAGATDALAAQAASSQANTWVSNASDGLSRLGLANQTLNQVLSELSQLQQAVESTSTAVVSPTGTASLASQLDGISKSLLANANTSYEGYAIFGGTSGHANAFDAAGTFQGNTTVPTRTVGPGITLAAGVTGDSIFGTGTNGLFGVIAQTVSDLRSGNVNAVLGTDLGKINSFYNHIQSSAATVGSLYNEMQAASTQATSTAQTLSTHASNLTAVDLPKVATELSLQSSTLQSALYTLSQAVPTSLLKYIA